MRGDADDRTVRVHGRKQVQDRRYAVMFWAGVAVGYVLLLGLGLSLGRYLASRFPDRGDGGHGTPPAAPYPTGPTHGLALDSCPPLGSAFDRALLPGAFDDAAVGTA